MNEKTYTVVVTREEGEWLGEVPGLAGAHTYARNLPGLDKSIREVIALVEDLPDGAEPTLNITFVLHTGDAEVDETTEQIRNDRERLRQAQANLARRTDSLVRMLTSRMSMSVRDTAVLTGLSPQRVSQLTNAEPHAIAVDEVHPALTSTRFDVSFPLGRQRGEPSDEVIAEMGRRIAAERGHDHHEELRAAMAAALSEIPDRLSGARLMKALTTEYRKHGRQGRSGLRPARSRSVSRRYTDED